MFSASEKMKTTLESASRCRVNINESVHCCCCERKSFCFSSLTAGVKLENLDAVISKTIITIFFLTDLFIDFFFHDKRKNRLNARSVRIYCPHTILRPLPQRLASKQTNHPLIMGQTEKLYSKEISGLTCLTLQISKT